MSGRRDQHDAKAPSRTEPTLGSLDQLDPHARDADVLAQASAEPYRPGRRRSHRSNVRRRRARWMVLLVLVLIVAITALWFNQARLRGMVPRTDFNAVLEQGQQALHDGRLDGHDGTSARELFEAAVALEPDSDRAQNGLHEVGLAELSLAQASLKTGNLSVALQEVTVARELLGGGRDIERIEEKIRAEQAAQVKTVELVEQAQQAMAAAKLSVAGAAYQRVLRADPHNAVAAHGLDQVGYALAMQARKAIDANDTAAANTSIEQLAALQPNNGALPALRALQAQRRKQDGRALTTALKQGHDAMRAGRIAGAGDNTALAYFRQAIKLDPENAQAREGLGNVAQALTVQANAAIAAGDTAQAARLLADAAELAPKSADLAAARARLQQLLTTPVVAPAAAPAPAPAPTEPAASPAPRDEVPLIHAVLSPQQNAELARLVQQAQMATRNGDIMMPPGNSAYDLYNRALAIDGNNAAASRGLRGLPAEVEQQFKRALRTGKLARADNRLADLNALAPGGTSQYELAQQLGSAWLDQAEHDLARGDRVGAGKALERGRKWAPNDPRVLDLTTRLQRGR